MCNRKRNLSHSSRSVKGMAVWLAQMEVRERGRYGRVVYHTSQRSEGN